MGFGGSCANVGVATGAQPASQLTPNIDLDFGIAHEQRLGIGIDRNELDASQAGVDHAVDGVHAAAADADDLDHCEVVDWCSHWCSIRAGGKSSSPELKCRV